MSVALFNPIPQDGRNAMTSLVVTPLTINDSGVVTEVTASAVALQALTNSIQPRISPVTFVPRNMRSKIVNRAIEQDEVNFSVEIYKPRNGVSPDPLRALVGGYDYFKIVWVETFGSTHTRTHTIRLGRGQWGNNAAGRGEQTASLEFLSADFGTDTYTIQDVTS
jgi:hypothetical protein